MQKVEIIAINIKKKRFQSCLKKFKKSPPLPPAAIGYSIEQCVQYVLRVFVRITLCAFISSLKEWLARVRLLLLSLKKSLNFKLLSNRF